MLERGFEFTPGYRLEVFLGRGQFGQVWQVTAPGGTSAAVKFIDLAEGQWEKEYEGIRRVKQIRHANLMPIIAIWLLDADGKVLEETTPDSPESQETLETVDLEDAERSGDWVLSHRGRDSARWLAVAMLLGGKSLLQRLKECQEAGSTGIPVKELLSYMEESAKGLDFLNSRVHDFGSGSTSLQHCDIKPANIVLIGSSAVICDFGLARIMARDQVTATSVAGTPAYMAPEAIGGKPSRTSDQYSLAVTYYQLRTGKLPLSDGSLWEVLDAHRLGNLRFDDVPEAEREVLRRATSLEWEKRFDSNQEMVEALREAIRTETTLPAVPPVASPSSRWRAGAVGAIAAVLLVPVAIYVWPTTQQEKEAVADGSGAQAEIDPSADVMNENGRNEVDPAVVAQRLQAALAAVSANATEAKTLFGKLLDTDPSIAQLNPTMLLGDQSDVVHLRILGENSAVLVTAADEQLRQFDLARLNEAAANGQPKEFEGIALAGHTNLIEVLTVSIDNRWCASGGYDSKVLIWDAQSADGKPSATLSDHQSDITAIAWHPKKTFLVTASADNQIGIWSLEMKNGVVKVDRSKSKIIPVPRAIEQLAFDSWGETVVCKTTDKRLGTISWEAIEESLLRDEELAIEPFSSPGASVGTFCMADDPDAADTVVIIGGDSGDVGFWSLKKRSLLHQESPHESAVGVCEAWEYEEQRVVVSGDAEGGLFLWRHDRPAVSLPGHSNMIKDLDISADGRWLAVAAYDGTVSLRDLQSDPTQFVSIAPAERRPMKTVKLDPSDRWLFSGGSDGRLYAWDLRLAKLLTWTRPTESLPPTEEPPADDEPNQIIRPDSARVTQL